MLYQQNHFLKYGHQKYFSETTKYLVLSTKRLVAAGKFLVAGTKNGVAVISAKNHKRQRRKRQSVTAKREKSQTPQVLAAILTLPNLT